MNYLFYIGNGKPLHTTENNIVGYIKIDGIIIMIIFQVIWLVYLPDLPTKICSIMNEYMSGNDIQVRECILCIIPLHAMCIVLLLAVCYILLFCLTPPKYDKTRENYWFHCSSFELMLCIWSLLATKYLLYQCSSFSKSGLSVGYIVGYFVDYFDSFLRLSQEILTIKIQTRNV